MALPSLVPRPHPSRGEKGSGQRRSDRVNGVNNYDHVRLENVQKSISPLYTATLLYTIVQMDLSSQKLLIDTLYPTCTPVGE